MTPSGGSGPSGDQFELFEESPFRYLRDLLLRGLRNLNLVGGDVVEVSPPFDPSGNTALVGATLMYEILCLLAEARSA